MRLLDSRRLTGANRFGSEPGAVIDISFGHSDPDLVIGAWRQHARRLLDELGWSDEQLRVLRTTDGASLALTAPADALYTATEVNEAAWDAARDLVEGGNRHLLLRAARALREELRDEERPRLRRLLAAAEARAVPVVLDADEVSLGLGRHSRCWDLRDVPHPDDVPWEELGAIPVGLVTGTNGKTTTVRMLNHIARAAGVVGGVSSTDWLAVGEDVLERSDFAGPGGARRVLRDPRCELAILETARGGLLRRGLALARADAALITNIASDHLGDFGVQTLDELADVKWIVTRALDERGTLVLNAEDPLLMARAPRSPAPVVLFSLDPRAPAFREHLAAGGVGYTLRRGSLGRCEGERWTTLVPVKRIPLCFDGAARHNVANALGAAALASALGLPDSAIRDGLCAMRTADNPGRANLYEIGGATVLLDFAHNPHGLSSLLELAATLPARRRLLIVGQAGDRSDADLDALADASRPMAFDRVLIKRMEGHARGRGPGEVAARLRDAFCRLGYARAAIREHKTELGAVRAALRWAGPGDLVVLLSHERRDATQAFLQARAAEAGAPS